MKILISPAKSMDFTSKVPFSKVTQPVFLNEAKKINQVLKTLTPSDLSVMMKISKNLSELNWVRNQERSFIKTDKAENFRQAIYAFDGEVYVSMDPYAFSANKIEILQEKLRILSGLYGVLKPLDEIEAYRLEMGTKIKIGESKNLYDFWKPTITNYLNKEMKEGELLVNLASNEYFSSIDIKQIKGKLVIPEFKELRDGKLKTYSFYAKKARGLMVRYIIDNNIESIDDIKSFNIDGYAYSKRDSKNEKIVFIR